MHPRLFRQHGLILVRQFRGHNKTGIRKLFRARRQPVLVRECPQIGEYIKNPIVAHVNPLSAFAWVRFQL
jgi:hypothetical protein